MIGTSLGPYKIIEQLGAGGMGEVYLGEDTRLGRKVAIKVLPPEFASDPERLARFEQEARAAAALNHPHIAVVHDVGSEPGEDGTTTHFMVQEYLEGQSLRQRLDRGAVPLDKALSLAIEIDEALVAAHKAGIVHRDLKPDNIFVTEEGHAKVLDFGLAKLTEIAAPTGSSASMSPTMLGTVAGQVMGTAGYMAPEQVNGEEVDHRADLFAFGCVLYGMVTGREPFSGKNVHETLSRILSDEPPPVAEIDRSLPPDLQRIVRKALAKDVSRRYQTAGDLGVDLRQLEDDIATGVAVSTAAAEAPVSVAGTGATAGFPWKITAPLVAAALAVGTLAVWFTTPDAPPEQVVNLHIALPEDVIFTGLGRRALAISPDDSRIVFVGHPSGHINAGRGPGQLFTRLLDAEGITPLPGIERAYAPFFSPDGAEIGFWVQTSPSESEIWRVSVGGGAVPVGAAASNPFGAHWAEDGMIYFGQGQDGIFAVPETGGTPELVVEMEAGEWASRPQLLPGGEWLLFTTAPGRDNTWNESGVIVAHNLATGDRVELVSRGTGGQYVATGHLVYWRDATLFAVPFDLAGLTTDPGGIPVLQGVLGPGRTGAGQFSISDRGTLIYLPGTAQDADVGNQLAWVSRDGQVELLPFEPRDSGDLDLSPDGRRVALMIRGDGDDDESDIWIYDVDRAGSQVRLTTEGNNTRPVWSDDGEWVYFASDRGGNRDIWKRRADQSGDAELVLDMEAPVQTESISADGNSLLFTSGVWPDTDGGLLALDTGEHEMLLDSAAAEYMGDFSPDGRFFTFVSDRTGRFEVYVRDAASRSTFPVSTSPYGGRYARWSRDGGEIYYSVTQGDLILMAEVTSTEPFSVSAPVEFPIIPMVGQTNFDVTEDGQRFLVTTRPAPADAEDATSRTPRISVILNWFEELKRLVSTDGSR